MMKVGRTTSRISLGVFLFCSSTVFGEVITIYSTGVDDLAALLPVGSPDPHYALISSTDPVFAGPAAYVSTIPSSYLPNNSISQWIAPGPNNSQTNSFAVGSYTYETIFDLTGLDPATAMLTGQFAGDDMANIILNGADTGATTGLGGWTGLHAFAIGQGFVAGINKLDFVVDNTFGGPSGLRVELSGTADAFPVTGVPEPYSFLPMLAGLGLGLYRKVRKSGLC